MLVAFSISNFLSFNEETRFSMVPGRSRKHLNQIIKGSKRNAIGILRFAVVYGANASGKTNLIRAIDFARQLIVKGTKSDEKIPLRCHKLKRVCYDLPSKFEFEIKVADEYYKYGFEIKSNLITSEWLFQTNSNSERNIFQRDENNPIDLKGIKIENKEDKEFLFFTAKGTRPNQLFLTECAEHNVKYFEPVYNWFKDTLKIIYPGSELKWFEKTEADLKPIAEYLKKFDTSILDLVIKESSFEDGLKDVPDGLRELFMKDISDKDSQAIKISDRTGQTVVVTKDKNDNIKALRLMTKHMSQDSGEDVLFDIGEESDGTLRMFDLIPTLITPKNNYPVYIIDELNRSLHPMLTRMLVNDFLSLSNPSQMIVTTHESNLLDLELLRRDEIWFTEKNNLGATNLFSLEEFSPRYDRDIMKGYLLGRFGGIPFLKTNKYSNK